ncbi:hypothetical protein GcM3_210012 [Golovinomyces cichoracearum]|uniref:Uncharacterized protein n=1 Tax=Golovinomyces cichoracearum TaxID=62708 RepID=A0A420HA05_9PEZI|nr:hypothetical protein GcM3_210012 [Golovinomyces cichoracearum]
MAGKSSNAEPRPTSPLRVPKAVYNYTTSTLDPELRSSINSRLLTDGHIQKIHDAILHSLHASPTNWPTLIQNHALALLRSGECTTFHEVLNRVLSDIHDDTDATRQSTNHTAKLGSSFSSQKAGTKMNASNGTRNSARVEAAAAALGESRPSLALPSDVVEEGIKITRECLETVCEIDD